MDIESPIQVGRKISAAATLDSNLTIFRTSENMHGQCKIPPQGTQIAQGGTSQDVYCDMLWNKNAIAQIINEPTEGTV